MITHPPDNTSAGNLCGCILGRMRRSNAAFQAAEAAAEGSGLNVSD
jgi:hypothetical protein